ncbi:uncharacterized protein LOC110721800 isoform X2 [Chenopodium quinoa]|uniref:uncharacterized protein LOC110721800 isoform X2 n=1 Tax=Chenopodium quinoa TaxID=63459 RepID=UPI000B787130|nr:uncharacterized protein LOC110721800 isoform X2 [Chenopodium quinoa]
MKLFGWMHGKFNGRSQSNNTSSTKVHASNKNQTPQLGAQKEEFSDWPQGFLSIGTLFNKSTKDDNIKENSPPSSQNPILDFTLEEVKELQKELNALMSSNDLNCLSSLDANRKEDDEEEDDEDEDQSDYQHDDTMVLSNNNKAKDVYLDYNGSKLIGKKSLKFLLKKAFICGVGGMGPTRSLKDPTLTVPKSRISKILRAMLRKKIYPQTSCPNMSKKRYLGNVQTESCNYDDDEDELDIERENRIKWDKSDTEFIVLEI